jgi:hypothetical protein
MVKGISELRMAKLNTPKNLLITAINDPNGPAHRTSKGLTLRKIKDALVMAVLVLAIVALTGGWIVAIGWMALKVIQWIFA